MIGYILGIKLMSKVIMSYLFNCPCNWAISITTLIWWGMRYYVPSEWYVVNYGSPGGNCQTGL
jgi:hypothetical protein